MLPLKLETTKDLITSHAGLALIGEFAAGFGLNKAIDRYLPGPGSDVGYLAETVQCMNKTDEACKLAGGNFLLPLSANHQFTQNQSRILGVDNMLDNMHFNSIVKTISVWSRGRQVFDRRPLSKGVSGSHKQANNDME